MVSFERVQEYTRIPPEPPIKTPNKNRPDKGWPNHGRIIFENFYLKYSPEGDYVLKDLSFKINPMEKVGIIGRTGAGKSSIIQALFRFAINEGLIQIDDIDIETLGLQDLRRTFSIIPQDPVLFSGTLRSNLDPFDEKSDTEIWNALSQVELKQKISTMNEGLVTKISDGGANFSMGERQLICLARAILRKNKILICDEATANVDQETDSLIQKTIRQKFSHYTVLTIAHRLHTIMDSDKVLVLDEGRIIEFGHPYELIQNSRGAFRQMLDKTGLSTSIELIKIAEKSYFTKRS
jgi:ATP-binding cassette subfamily C (CFTR/MRP) protein 4